MCSTGGVDGDDRAWRVDMLIRGHAATVGVFYAALPTFDSVEQAEEHYRAALINYLRDVRLPDGRYRVVVELGADSPSAELEFRRAAPLEEPPPRRWGQL
jgi:hypothetical protein